jgi:hypothetical protein
MGQNRKAYRTLMERAEGNRPLGRPRLVSWIILRWVLMVRTGLICLRIGAIGQIS